MTENRCIEVLKKMKHMFTETCAKIDENTALNMAVEAIKEIQQYRAIGTVEEIENSFKKTINAFEKANPLIKSALDILQEYQSIGTIEELKALKEIDEDLRLKYCYEDLSNADNSGYMRGYAKAIDDCLAVLYQNAGKFISTELYYKVYERVEKLKGGAVDE